MTRWILALALCASTHAFAQVAEFSVSGGQSRLRNNGIGTLSTTGGTKDDVQLRDGFRLGFRLTLNNWRFFGHEFGYGYNRTQFRIAGSPPQDYGTAIHQGFYDFLVYAAPEGKRVRPFAAGGGQFSNFIFPGGSVSQGGGSTKFGFNYGGGIKARVSQMFMIRLDLRQYQSGKPFGFPLAAGLLRQTEVSAGVAFVL
jgi:opacity protein-like surface antigen